MCGIFAYVGRQNNAPQIVLEGLKLLEYRGYDSWGIALKNQKSKIKNQKLLVDKHIGKISNTNLKSLILNRKSSLAIGHTRWATHGGVTVENAHPHLDCRKQIAVLHNGIIENFAKLKEELLKRGHKFYSETDTEVVSHLIEEHLKREAFPQAVQHAFNKLRGLNAIVVMSSRSKKIVAAKNGSPLIIGKGKNEFFVASDASGIIKHTKQLLFLNDNEMVSLNNSIKLFSLPNGTALKPQFQTIDWNIQDVSKGKYPHFMLKEIHEQPKVIRNIAQNFDSQISSLAKNIQQAKGTFFIAAGTAFHACIGGAYLFSKIAKKHINTALASEFNYLEDFLTKDSLIIALSQSGETIDVIEPLQRAQKKGAKIAGIVNTLGSTIYRMADHKLLLGAGPEKAVASTKAYLAKLSILFMLSYALNGGINKAKKLLTDAADETERLLNEKQILKIAEFLKNSEHVYVIGRGASYSSTLEAALKIKEVSYIHTEGLAGGELKHGTIALISKGTPCIVFAPKDEAHEAILSNAMEIKSRGGVIIGISPENSDIFDYWIEVKDLNDASVIPQIVPAQLLAYHLAILKGNDPDKPRNLAKSVTVK